MLAVASVRGRAWWARARASMKRRMSGRCGEALGDAPDGWSVARHSAADVRRLRPRRWRFGLGGETSRGQNERHRRYGRADQTARHATGRRHEGRRATGDRRGARGGCAREVAAIGRRRHPFRCVMRFSLSLMRHRVHVRCTAPCGYTARVHGARFSAPGEHEMQQEDLEHESRETAGALQPHGRMTNVGMRKGPPRVAARPAVAAPRLRLACWWQGLRSSLKAWRIGQSGTRQAAAEQWRGRSPRPPGTLPGRSTWRPCSACPRTRCPTARPAGRRSPR